MSEVEGRREFLKKAGTVAWVVPTLQVVNMTSAFAGADGGTGGSVVVTTTTEAPQCRCSLSETGRQPADDLTAAVSFHISVSDDCVDRAKYLAGYADGESIGLIEFVADFVVLVPFDAFPFTLTIEVLDAQQSVLTSCSKFVEGMEERPAAGEAAAGGGRIRFGR